MALAVKNLERKVYLLMAENDMSMEELAKKTGMMRQTINKITKSKYPRPTTIAKFAKAFAVPPQFFYDE